MLGTCVITSLIRRQKIDAWCREFFKNDSLSVDASKICRGIPDIYSGRLAVSFTDFARLITLDPEIETSRFFHWVNHIYSLKKVQNHDFNFFIFIFI